MKKTSFVGFVWAIALLVTLGSAGAVHARDITLKANVIRVEKVDGEEIVTFLTFTAVTDDTTVTGSSGTYNRVTDVFEAKGSSDERVVAIREGDDPFEITATETLSIALDSEMLRAEGDVRYVSGDTTAQSNVLIVNERDYILSIVQPLIDKLPQDAGKSVIIEFFERTNAEDKLVFMQDNVVIDQKDSSLRASWVVFNESESDELISVAADDFPLELIFSSEKDGS